MYLETDPKAFDIQSLRPSRNLVRRAPRKQRSPTTDTCPGFQSTDEGMEGAAGHLDGENGQRIDPR